MHGEMTKNMMKFQKLPFAPDKGKKNPSLVTQMAWKQSFQPYVKVT